MLKLIMIVFTILIILIYMIYRSKPNNYDLTLRDARKIISQIKRRYLILLSLMQNEVMTLVNIKFLILIEIRLLLRIVK